MVVIILERVSPSLRGELTRWMLEPRAGVFVGQVSALVRDKLWERVCASMNRPHARGGGPGGAGMLIYSTDNEQGFAMRFWGSPERVIEDFEGLSLIRVPQS